MYQKVIVSLSLDQGFSERAFETARALKAENGMIYAVHVYEPLQGSASAYVTDEAVNQAYSKAKETLDGRVNKAPDVEAVLLKGHSGRAITDYAHDIGADCIIVGSHKPGLKDFLLGSTAARIVRHAPCSVVVLR
ncbi:MAG: nucleotide-binding universal stress UspA family protein [Paracoccaceae bacterium]|jgi:nucleotide-binding universal stress UspA family protein